MSRGRKDAPDEDEADAAGAGPGAAGDELAGLQAASPEAALVGEPDHLAEQVAAAYHAAYDNEPFVRLLEGKALPDTKNVTGTNCIEIAWRTDPRTGRLIVMSAEDNIVKGASGQAVQSLNLVAGWPETTGLV